MADSSSNSSSKAANAGQVPADSHWYDIGNLPSRLGRVLRAGETLEGLPIVLDKRCAYDERPAHEVGGMPRRIPPQMPVGPYTVQYRLPLARLNAAGKPIPPDQPGGLDTHVLSRPVQLRILPSPPPGRTSWGEVGTSGLQLRLILPKRAAQALPALTPDRLTARLEVRNTSNRTIRLAEQNTTGGRRRILDEWLIGLYVDVRTPGKGARRFFRADDQDGYWSQIGGGPSAKHIKPGETLTFRVRPHKLVDDRGTNLLTLGGRHELRPVLDVRDHKFGLWHGTARGALVRVTLAPEAGKE